ncbi:MAG: DNA polymerase III subunit alpha, partial [Bacteroidales bacterium]|nr:DNA polymerase III subunit alpha [Bacteroidales bacterium]
GKDLDDATSLHYTGKEYLKSADEMAALFPEHPEALANTLEISNKIEEFTLNPGKNLLPHFPLPDRFTCENEYLEFLTYEGAKILYPDLTLEIKERIDYELSVIATKGFSGYFLIVQDFIRKAREMDVVVGPGRGSAAGSIVSYCLEITRVDPIRYQLLFERFLNPERPSLPDIDVDFDDEGREKVLRYVVEKYGENRVAQIVTFGTMAARSAIRDVARVLKVPLPEADRLAKLVPEKAGTTLKQAFKSVPELQEIAKGDNQMLRKTLEYAQILEGLNRHTGKHACGVIIGPDDLINYVPLSLAKDSDMMMTQYEGKLIGGVGLLKIDFLGLKTLSIIKDAIVNIRRWNGDIIDIEQIPLDDETTFSLFKRGDTVGTFQFESEGMRGYLRELEPGNMEDLIAMNALYRPGPMDFIPTYIRRKHGREAVTYPLPVLEPILNYTYGIMVYQEQIMEVAQKIANFTPGRADKLREVMGKKIIVDLPVLQEEFMKGALENGYSIEESSKTFDIMKEFANYGFNRSHAAAYAIISYHTAYLKAHYPAAFMAAVLTHNLSDIKKITYFIDECRRMDIAVLGPDINESELNFTVNKKGEIRFGLAAVKGVGEGGVQEIITDRDTNGPFANVFDLAKRINLRSVNRRTFEALAFAGAFDCFSNMHRAQYFYREKTDDTIFLDKIIRFASNYQNFANSAQHSLFGGDQEVMLPAVEIPVCEPWLKMEQLKFEKEVTGFYMSGHPLDDFKLEFDTLCNVNLTDLKEDAIKLANRDLVFGGIVTAIANKIGKNGKPYSTFTLEDFSDQYTIFLFSEDYLRHKHFLVEGTTLLIKARMQSRFGQEERYELKIGFICLMAEALDKLVHNITLHIVLRDVDETTIKWLHKVMKANKGDCAIAIRVTDPEERIFLNFPAPKYKVECSNLLREISAYKTISYILN